MGAAEVPTQISASLAFFKSFSFAYTENIDRYKSCDHVTSQYLWTQFDEL